MSDAASATDPDAGKRMHELARERGKRAKNLQDGDRAWHANGEVRPPALPPTSEERQAASGPVEPNPLINAAVELLSGDLDAVELDAVEHAIRAALEDARVRSFTPSGVKRVALLRLRDLLAKEQANGIAPESNEAAARQALAIVKDARSELLMPPAAERVLARVGAGPLLHMLTGIATLDDITRGGLLAGRIAVIGGAPDAGKTSLAVQIANWLARAGYAVAIHCVDEDREGIECRIGQACGLSLEQLEQREQHALDYLAGCLAEVPNLIIVDQDEDEMSIEDTAAALDALAQRLGCPGKVIVIDSLQTARARGVEAARTAKDRADIITAAAKRIARRTGALVIITSELSRGSYRTRRAKDRTAPMAAFKESGAIEYAMTIGLVLQNVKGDSNLVEVEVPKNKRGRAGVTFRLRRDPDRCTYADAGIVGTEDESEERGAREAGDRQTEIAGASPLPGALVISGREAQDIERARHVLRSHPEGLALELEWIPQLKPMRKTRARIAIRKLERLGEVGERKDGRRIVHFWCDPETRSDCDNPAAADVPPPIPKE